MTNKSKLHLTLSISQLFIASFILSVALISCDVFEKEDSSVNPSAKLTKNSLFITPQSSGIFDLKTMIQTTGSTRVEITTPPSLGSLQTIGKDFLKYTPNAGIRTGRDKFLISVFSSANNFLSKDSVTIILSEDTVNIPCGLNVMNDFIYGLTSSKDIDVLANDYKCIDRSKLIVTIDTTLIKSPTHSYFGTVQVLSNGNIRYTPGTDYKGQDKFVYRVDKPENIPNPGDPATSGFGFVYLSGTTSCKDKLQLMDDSFSFNLSTLNKADTLNLNTAANDVLCTTALNNFSFGFTTFPKGKLYYGPNYTFKYVMPSDAAPGSTDKFSYSMCVDDVCKEAKVTISFQ